MPVSTDPFIFFFSCKALHVITCTIIYVYKDNKCAHPICNGVKCNLGNVWVEPMLASSLQGNHAWWGLIQVFTGLTRFACQLCENVQFAFECHSCLLSAFASLPPSLSLVTESIWVGKYLHWLCQCDSAWWLPLSGLPWIPACSVRGSYLGSTISKAPFPTSSIGHEFNIAVIM